MTKNSVFTDSLILASVKTFTMVTSILATMILSRTLPLVDYGTYSTGVLIINTATLVSAFGLIDAVNYYYNGKKIESCSEYINTIFFLFIICGSIVAAAILGAKSLLTQYFHNPKLGMIYAYIAFRPFLQNCSSGLQNLQVSIGKSKNIAIRNAVLSISKLSAVLLTALYTKKITTIFICMLLVEMVALLFYYKTLLDNRVFINPFKPNFTKLKEILSFCIPMGIYIQVNSLSRDLDKFVIGYYESTENLAIYTNCSTKLPFDIISGPLLILLVPLLTRCIRVNDIENGSKLFCNYLRIGYIFTITFGIGCIIIAPEIVRFLFGIKYLSGTLIFIIYIIVDMLNFINFSLALAAKGKTKKLMQVSCIALGLNFLINILFYKILGFNGPAIATVLVTFGVNFCLLYNSAKILHRKIIHLFFWKHIFLFFIESLFFSIGFYILKLNLQKLCINYIIILMIIGVGYVGVMLLTSLSVIKKSFAILNYINQNKEIRC